MNTKSIIEKYPIFFIVILALIVRIVLFFFVPIPDQFGGDFYFYEHLAKTLLQGKGFDGELYVTPGWSFFLMILYFITGSSSMAVPFIGQTILGVLIAVAAYILAKHLFSRETAILAGTMMALWPVGLITTFYFGDGLLLYTVLFSFSVIFFIKSWSSNRIALSVASGFLLAMAALTDSVALYLPVAFLFWWLFSVLLDSRKYCFSFKKLILITIFLVTFILSLSPWVYRNSVVFKGMRQAPFISKQIEKDFIGEKHFKSISQTFSFSKFSLLFSGIRQMFFVPYGISVLDSGTKIEYKKVAEDIFVGKTVQLSSREITIFVLKILLSVAHWFIVLFAVFGLFLLRSRRISVLFVFILGYVTFAAIGFGSLSSYKGISPLSGFFFPFLPFLLVFTAQVITTRIEPFFNRMTIHTK